MKNFFWISRLYFKRNFLVPANYLLIGLPLIFTTAFHMMTNIAPEADFTFIAIPLILSFQFFSADVTAGWLHEDLKGPTGARLLVSGNHSRVFYISVITTSWLFSLLMGALLIPITSIFFNIEWANIPLSFLALAFLSLITQIAGVLIFYFTKDTKAAGKIGYLFGEIMIGIAIFPSAFNITFLENITKYFPVGLGVRLTAAMSVTDAIVPTAILIGIVIVLSAIVLVVEKRKNYV